MMEDILEKRRSYRSLERVAVTDETVQTLAHAASLMPSCFNNQPWRFVFVRADENLEKLKAVYNKGNEWAYRASMVIAVVARDSDDCQLQGKHYAQFDTGMAIGAMLLAGTESDLVLHPIAGFDTEKAKQILSIPEDFTLITLIICGKKSTVLVPGLADHQKESEAHRPERKPPGEFVFFEAWGTAR